MNVTALIVGFLVGFLAGVGFTDWFKHWWQKRLFFKQMKEAEDALRSFGIKEETRYGD